MWIGGCRWGWTSSASMSCTILASFVLRKNLSSSASASEDVISLSMTPLHLTCISVILDVSLVLPDSQDFFNTQTCPADVLVLDLVVLWYVSHITWFSELFQYVNMSSRCSRLGPGSNLVKISARLVSVSSLDMRQIPDATASQHLCIETNKTKAK